MTDKPKITTERIGTDYDESKLDRVGNPIGVEHHDAGEPDGYVNQITQRHTLQDMSEDYEFFTTGVVHAVSLFDRDPVVEYCRQYPGHADEMPMAIDTVAPFFQGLGTCLTANTPVNFDRRIYAVLRERWLNLRDMVAGIAMMEKASGFYARLNFYELEIVDPFALRRQNIVNNLPKVPITVFGVSSNCAFAYLAPQVYPLLPKLTIEQPKQDMILEGNSVLGPPPSPEHLMAKKHEGKN